MKTALLLTIVGLVIEAFCVVDLTPASFVVFAAVGMPLVGLGILVFVATVWRVLRETKGL
jgi:hypothetical protein